jgi:predicted secreted protein
MSWSGGIALYFIVWWLTLFAILPIGVRSQHEDGDVAAGTDPGAPVLPAMGRKLIYTSIAALPFFGLIWVLITYVDF